MDSILGSILGKISSFTSGIRLRNDDDFIDRLNHRYTTIILLIFTAVITTKEYAGNPIHCWCPAEYKATPYYEYINQVCWVSNTYYVHMEDTIPDNSGLRKEMEIQYYQWVPIILLAMALLFKLPRILWKLLISSAPFKLDKFITMVKDSQLASQSDRTEKLDDLVSYIQEWRQRSRPWRHGIRRHSRRITRNLYTCEFRWGNYFVTSAFLVKTLYLVNACIQFMFLNDFLGTDFKMFGFQIMDILAHGNHNNLKPSPRFPFVTLCDFQLRLLQNVQNWTIQCVLPINLFNEKIFICIWFWLAAICALNAVNLLSAAFAIMFPARRLHSIKNLLKLRHIYCSRVEEKHVLKKFVHSYLSSDGYFVIHAATQNGSEILASYLVERLFFQFKSNLLHTESANGEMPTVK